ncbi:hypothetical protein [Natronomonas marina]|uniref:hypothetical protein n=1 Tax=Natronomonas marina TaxID=2961939 RepID=UPI0020C98014|nr:hypothetical protein [Natronomonas marina]
MSNDKRGDGGDETGAESRGTETADTEGPDDDRRRRVLVYGGLAALGATGVAGAWFGTRGDPPAGDATPTPTGTDGPTPTGTDEDAPTETPDETAPELVRRYAPDLYFGRLEKWYPTDPREYVPNAEEPVPLEGIAALEGYSEDARASDGPPFPTVFYRVTEAAEGVDAVQYWMYSAFDQFTVNFHWHDWELLQVFVDAEAGDPLLLSASAHSRKVPNNEVLDPSAGTARRPGVLSEVGSHSSATDVNDAVPSFERVADGALRSDVTNDFLEAASSLRVPFAYGLPRDEGARLPFVVPELGGHRLDEHPDLDLERSDFVDEAVTVTDWNGIPTPPEDLPLREPGLVLTAPNSPTAGDDTYALEPIEAVREEISSFDGPQLSFEFGIPGYVEDQVAGHITTVGIPWEQPRYEDPLSDVTDPAHRAEIDGSRPAGLTNRVVGRVRQLRSGADGTLDRVVAASREAIEDVATVSFVGPPTELATQLASQEPVATVTNAGLFGFLRVDPGDHRLVVDGPGYAPFAERFTHDGGLVTAGAAGRVGVVANADAARIRGDGRATTGIERVRVVEDYAGPLYDGRPVEPDRFAVAVHRAGRYTVDVVDSDGRRGSYRVGPDDFAEGGDATVERVETGKASLTRSLRDLLVDLRNLASRLQERDGADSGVVGRLAEAISELDAAIEAAAVGEAAAADERLGNVVRLLEGAVDALRAGRNGYSDESATLLVRRLRRAIGRAERARATEVA